MRARSARYGLRQPSGLCGARPFARCWRRCLAAVAASRRAANSGFALSEAIRPPAPPSALVSMPCWGPLRSVDGLALFIEDIPLMACRRVFICAELGVAVGLTLLEMVVVPSGGQSPR